MALWEYKVITSGKGGFARPDLMEKFLNDLGRDEWEIIQFHTHPDNFLAFTGLARRSTQRDWTLEDAAAAAAKVEAERLRAEFEAKFKAAASGATTAAAEEVAPTFLEEKASPDDGLRKLVDTSHDGDPEAEEDDKADEWDKLTAAEADELPSFFEAIRPHMRRNQRGPGMSVGVEYLAKKWDLSEDDLTAALAECGFVMPEDEDSPVQYLEYDGDLFWLNINRRGELWINTKEKPRPVFRAVKGTRLEPEPPKAESTPIPGGEATVAPAGEVTPPAEGAAAPVEGTPTAGDASKPAAAPLPEGTALLDKIRPHMRRNRRGPGGSGSASFLSRALRTNETELRAAFAALGFTLPTSAGEKPVYAEFGRELWWLNLDSRGGLWINGREKKDGENIATAPTADATDAATAPDPAAPAVDPAIAETAPVGTAEAAAAPAEGAATSVEGEVVTPAPAPSAIAEAVPAEIPVSPVLTASADCPSPPSADIAPAEAAAPADRPVSAVGAPADVVAVTAPAAEEATPSADDAVVEDEGAKKTGRRPARPRTKKGEQA